MIFKCLVHIGKCLFYHATNKLETTNYRLTEDRDRVVVENSNLGLILIK